MIGAKRVIVIGSLILLLISSSQEAFASETDHLYAVLINGGRNRLTNHERYWNDCAFLYRTLRQTFHVPRRNITVLMSDGGAPDEDMLRADGRGFLSSPIDLDGDGQADIDYPATYQAVSRTMINLSRQLTSDDHLFLFVMDHGGSNSNGSFIWLWADEQLDVFSLTSLLGMFHTASVNILMGQCYSGGFVNSLIRDGRVIATACGSDEQSWVCPDRPYDEFVYHWICAVNGADEMGNPIDADDNDDGEVSMQEAFQYAQSHDRVHETPQYASWPMELGAQWTFPHALLGPLAIHEVTTEQKSSAVWTISGQRRNDVGGHAIYIQRHNGKTRKIIR